MAELAGLAKKKEVVLQVLVLDRVPSYFIYFLHKATLLVGRCYFRSVKISFLDNNVY